MSPIEYIPPMLKSVVEDPYAQKRLKNRTGILTCTGCSLTEEGHILPLVDTARKHDDESGHHMEIVEDSCRMSLVQQSE